MNNEIILEVRNISKYYEYGKIIALDSVNIKVGRGEFLAVKGSSGSGKSTLLHIIGGLDSPTKGEVYFEGHKLKILLREAGFRINHIGFVFQAFYLWPILNVFENIYLPFMESPLSKKEKKARIVELASIVGLKHKLFSPVNKLSMGERQRVAITRALIMRPQLLLADEPTGNLDSKNAGNILALFRKINTEQGVTIIMVTHEVLALNFCSRVINIMDGRIVDAKERID